MAAPIIAAVKVGYQVHKAVQKYVPGGWKTVIATSVIVAVLVPLLIVTSLATTFQMTSSPPPFCAPNMGTVDEGGGDSHGGGGENAGGSGSASGATTPFPSESSSKIVYPVKASAISSGYGPRYISISANTFHDGTDMAAPMRTPIVSMADGIVSRADVGHQTKYREGSMVEVQHNIKGQKYTTAYRHVVGASIKVKVGDKVKAGQQIAGVGTEGYSSGPHLHFVVAKGYYHRFKSTKSAAGTVDSLKFLKSNGAETASGGLDGKDFGDGVSEDDPGSVECGDVDGEARLMGDGTTKWNNFKNGKFESDDLATVGGKKLFKDAARNLGDLLAEYKSDKKKTIAVKKGYVSYAEQKKLYNANKQVEKPGKSIFGFARIAKLDIKSFKSSEYKWMMENASEYGWEQPSAYQEGAASADPSIWGFVGGGESTLPPAGSASAKESQAIAKKMMARDYPEWASNEFAKCLVPMWQKESGWDYKAANPNSTARGIPQMMMSVHFGSNWASNAKGKNYLSSPEAQVKVGLKYVKDRYSTPCTAWVKWQTQQWY